MGLISTVRGEIPGDALGQVLAHEHVVNVNADVEKEFPAWSWPGGRAAAVDAAVGALDAAVQRGIGTLVDCTVAGHGRDIAALQEINERVDINIVVATGLYSRDFLHPFFRLRPPVEGRDVLTDMFVHDIEVGVQGTMVKAGVIKCVTDVEGITENVGRVLTAAAKAHRIAGAPITTHSDVAMRNGLDQQDLFASLGVDLTRVVIGHSGDSDDFDYLRRILDRGSFVGADRFGWYIPGRPSLEQRIDTVVGLCDRGYSAQILLAHDSSAWTDWWDPAVRATQPQEWTLTHIPDAVLPALRERGVSEEQIHEMLVDNPRRLLERNEPY